MNVKSAFLHGNLIEEIYIEKYLGFMIDSGLSYRLKNSLGGLKQEPHAWYEKVDHLFVTLGFIHCESHPNIYVLYVHDYTLIITVTAQF